MNIDFDYLNIIRRNALLGYKDPEVQEKEEVKVVPTELIFGADQPSCLFEHEGGIVFRGQEEAKNLIVVHVDTLKAEDRFKALVSGAAGCGKTALCWIIAKRIQNKRQSMGLSKGRFFEILPSQISSKKELDVFMQNLKDFDVVFMDEVHILRQNVGAEPLYHTLHDTGTPRYPLDEGKGWLDIPGNVSWIAATTEPGELDGTTGGALRRRLSPEIRLEPPGIETLIEILLDQPVSILKDAAKEIATRSGGLPWQVLNLYRTAVKVAALRGEYPIDKDIAYEAFRALGVDEYGLFAEDREIIRILLQSPYKMRSTGEVRYKMSEAALCSAAGVDPNTYRHLVQPRLMRLGFLTTVGGQCLSERAIGLFKNE